MSLAAQCSPEPRSHVNTDVTLATNTSDGTHGQYHVTTRTSNAPLRLTVLDAPVDSVLTASAHSSNSPVHVTLHETYEGSFDASASSWFHPEVRWKPVEDPAGRGRQRYVQVESDKRSHVRGFAFWDLESKERGSVTLDTSNSPLRLDLTKIDE